MTDRARRNVIVTVVALVVLVVAINLIARVSIPRSAGAARRCERLFLRDQWYRPVGLRAAARGLRPSGATAAGQPREHCARPAAMLILTGSARPAPLQPTSSPPSRPSSTRWPGGAGGAARRRTCGRSPASRPSSSAACATTTSSRPSSVTSETVRTDGVFGVCPAVAMSPCSRPSPTARSLDRRRAPTGTVLLLAEATPLQNAAIGAADNAAFGLALPGAAISRWCSPKACTVTASGAGSRAIPDRWQAGLVLLGLAAILFAWSRARRLGPPDRPDRELPPARPCTSTRWPTRWNAPRSARGARAAGRVGAQPGQGRRRPPARRRSRCRHRGRATHGPLGRGDRDTVATARRRRRGAGPRTRGDPRDRRKDVTVNELRDRVVREVRKVVVGQDHVVDVMLAATSVGGHVLLEGVPGVAKTLVANAFARAVGVEFRRVQFTPDMLPSDLTGTMTLRAGGRARVPARTRVHQPPARRRDQPHAAEDAGRAARGDAGAPGERRRHRRDRSPTRSSCVATQNPIEYEGTYPLPEAQLDRFLAKLDVGYPDAADEAAMLRLAHRGVAPATLDDVQAVTTPTTCSRRATLVDATTVSEEVDRLRRRARAPHARAAECRARREPACRRAPARRGQGRGPARGSRVRRARRRRRGRAGGAAPPAPAQPEAELERYTHRRRGSRPRSASVPIPR